MARRSISAAILLLLAAAAGAQAFGRFGYAEAVDVPGFLVEKKGFRVRQDQADWFTYENPSKVWRPALTTDTSQTVLLSGIGRGAEKARFDLFGSGFSLYFRHGMGLKLNSNQPPFLTWEEGSAGAGVPTPPTKWLLVTFRDKQPPVLLALPDGPQAFIVTGKPGDWLLRSAEPFQGWVRVAAPLGLAGIATHNAESLGGAVARVKPLLKYLTEPVPRLLKTELEEDATSVTATWLFDRPYAVVPLPLVLAPLGGYGVKLETPLDRLDSTDPSGPTSVARDATLRVRFPVRRIPTGRSLTIGHSLAEPLGTISPIDIPSVADLAFANLAAGRDVLTKSTAEEALAAFLGEARYHAEPFSGQKLPYAEDGAGIDLAAAHALLMQSTITTVKATSEPNSLLTSVLWRRDWRTWSIWVGDVDLGRRAAALAALAAALCPEPERRLDAALLEAGLSAQTGLDVWRARYGMPPGPKMAPPPYVGARQALFAYAKRKEADEAFVQSLLSEIRVFGDHVVRAELKDGALVIGWQMETVKPTTVILASAYQLDATPETNLESASTEHALGFTVIRCTPKAPGLCQMRVKTPDWAAPLPKYVEPPRYGN